MHSSKRVFASVLALLIALTSAAPAPPSPSPAAPAPHNSEFVTLGCPRSTTPTATECEQRVAAQDFAQKLYIQKDTKGAFARYVARDLINHAPDIPGDGAATAEPRVAQILAPSKVEIQWVTLGQNLASTFFKATSPQGTVAAMDVFRMSGTCLVEHWVVQSVVTNSSNPHPYF